MLTATAFLVRALLVTLFLPFSALDKMLNFNQAKAQARQGGPAALAPVLVLCGFGIEVFMSAAILTGIADRLAALILAGYCIVTALLWKQFWKVPGFRLGGPAPHRDLFWDSEKLRFGGRLLATRFRY